MDNSELDTWYLNPLSYKLDNFPRLRDELANRACLNYPNVSGVFLVYVNRAQKEDFNKIESVKDSLANLLDSLAESDPKLEFELKRAYGQRKTVRQIIHQAFVDLQRAKDPGMKKGIQKYHPLIEEKDGYVKLTMAGELLFEALG
jgi:hypothetical protein